MAGMPSLSMQKLYAIILPNMNNHSATPGVFFATIWFTINNVYQDPDLTVPPPAPDAFQTP
jgi:hypothetical protein